MPYPPKLPEQQRLQYLQYLGVTSWLPMTTSLGKTGPVWQSITPGITATVGILAEGNGPGDGVSAAEPVIDDTAATIYNDTENHHQQAQKGVMGASLDKTFIATTPALTPKITLVTETAPYSHLIQDIEGESVSGNEASLAAMHLSYSWYSVGVLVINEMPIKAGITMSNAIINLQTAMVNALGLDPWQMMPASQGHFYWPLVPGPYADQSRTGAEQAIHYQLQKMLVDKPLHRVLLLGESAIDLLLPGEAQLGRVYTLFGTTVLTSHSLHRLFSLPKCKAETWQHMQQLLDN